MAEKRQNLLSKKGWITVWAILSFLTFLVYPGQTSFINEWLPLSVLTNYGMMVVLFIVAWFFTKDILD